MAENTVVTNTGSQAHITTDTSRIFLYENRYETDSYVNNSGYNPITLLAGTVMGRVSATGVLVPWQKGSSDGSQTVVGILAQDLVIDAGATENAAVCIYGDVNESKVLFFNSAATGASLETVDNGRRMRDRIKGDTAGIRLIVSDEMTGYDNQ